MPERDGVREALALGVEVVLTGPSGVLEGGVEGTSVTRGMG